MEIASNEVVWLSIVPLDPSSLSVWLKNNRQLMLLKALELLEAMRGVESPGQAFQAPALGFACHLSATRQISDISESTDFSDDYCESEAHEMQEFEGAHELMHLKQAMEKLSLVKVEKAIGKDGMARAQNLISKINIEDLSAMEMESTKGNLEDDVTGDEEGVASMEIVSGSEARGRGSGVDLPSDLIIEGRFCYRSFSLRGRLIFGNHLKMQQARQQHPCNLPEKSPTFPRNPPTPQPPLSTFQQPPTNYQTP